jgi:hypothetical protein
MSPVLAAWTASVRITVSPGGAPRCCLRWLVLVFVALLLRSFARAATCADLFPGWGGGGARRCSSRVPPMGRGTPVI